MTDVIMFAVAVMVVIAGVLAIAAVMLSSRISREEDE